MVITNNSKGAKLLLSINEIPSKKDRKNQFLVGKNIFCNDFIVI